MRVRVEGQTVFNNIFHVLNASVDGCGLANLPEEIAAPLIAEGKLVRVPEDWCPYWDGYHLCYSGRRAPSRALPCWWMQ